MQAVSTRSWSLTVLTLGFFQSVGVRANESADGAIQTANATGDSVCS